jgi:rhamnogalacturonyl hydrolase YesR
MIKKIPIFFMLLLPSLSQAQLKHWPKGASPEEIGKRVASSFLLSPHGFYSADAKPHIPYFEVCNWYGALTFARLTDDTTLSSQLLNRFKPLLEKDSALLPVPDHVDYSVFGALPLEFHLQKKDPAFLELGIHYADKQWSSPSGPRVIPKSFSYYNNGLSWQTRLWIDDMYMITLLQAQAYRATGDRKYIDRAAKEMVFYLDALQQSNGLFYHAADAPFFWGRGNGWMAAGMAELLRALPKDNPDRIRIMKGFKAMMTSLLSYQASSGMWRQLMEDVNSWEETSSTGMFCFAMITGVKNGWLEEDVYGRAARKAWLALISFINDKGEVTNVCEGTGKKNDRQYYLDRKRVTGDMHGQAPVLWCASALLRAKDK